MVSVSVITPTVARPSLRHTLLSIVPQLGSGDESIVISDGPSPARDVCREFPQCRYIETKPTYEWGNYQRDVGIAESTGTHLAFCDDDDILLPDAIRIIKMVAREHPKAMLMFKVHMHNYKAIRHDYLWHERTFRDGNIPSCGIVVPRFDPMPTWAGNGYSADYTFAQTCAQHCEVIWREEVIAQTRPL